MKRRKFTQVERYLGRASSATLGYIANNVPGAYAAYKAFNHLENLTDNYINKRRKMAPIHRTPTRQRRLSFNKMPTTPRKRYALPTIRRRLFKRSGIKRNRYRGRMKKQKPASGHSVISSNFSKIFRSKAKLKIKRTMGIWRHMQTHIALVTTTAGNQAVADLLFVNTVPQNITSTGTSYGIFQAATAYEQLNPNLTNTGSGYLGSSVTPPEDRWVVLDHNINIEWTNFSPVAAHVDVYVMKCLKPTNQSAYTLWSTGYAAMAFGTPQVTLPPAGTTVGTVGYDAVNVVGARPTDTRLFKDFWKIVQCKSFDLAGNESFNDVIHIVQNQVKKREDLTQLSANGSVYHSGSFEVFYIVRGQVVLDTTVALSPKPTFGSIKIGYVAQVKTNLQGVKDAVNRLNTNNVVVNYPNAASLANQSLINEVDAQVNPF